MPRKLTQVDAEMLLIAHFIDPLNGYTWWEAEATKQTQEDYREAATTSIQDKYPDGIMDGASPAELLFNQALDRADFKAVMRGLVALRRVFFPGS